MLMILSTLQLLLRVFISFHNSSRSLCRLGRFLLFNFVLLRRHLALLAFRLAGDLPQLVLALNGSGEGQRRLDEIQREDSHVSVEAVLGHLQGPAAGARHQLLLLQDQDVVGFLAGLEGGQGSRCVIYYLLKSGGKETSQFLC